jgi:hypothetical protein
MSGACPWVLVVQTTCGLVTDPLWTLIRLDLMDESSWPLGLHDRCSHELADNADTTSIVLATWNDSHIYTIYPCIYDAMMARICSSFRSM